MAQASPGSSLSSLWTKEDWWAVWIGLAIVLLSTPDYLGTFLLGWIPAVVSWTNISSAFSLKIGNPLVCVPAALVFLALLMAPAVRASGVRMTSWLKGFTTIFIVSFGVWVASNYTPVVKAMGSAEIGYVSVLLIGLALANLTTIPQWLKDSSKPELFVKTAIVLLGAKILLTTFATSALGVLTAVFLSFPVVWLVSFLLSRRVGLDRDLSATLSSGVGVCGISAAMATASAIEAPPIYSTLVSSIIVIFSAIEILVMPFVASLIFPSNFQAAGVWMGLSVKTDGAASASGSVVDGMLKANGASLAAAVQTKVLIDVWIGLIAFILASVWAYKFKKATSSGEKPSLKLLWYRFPKFVIGYFVASIILSGIALTYPTVALGAKAVAPIVSSGTDPLRVMFFAFTFFGIGINTRFASFKQTGVGRPAVVYAICLTVAIIWGGLVSYLVFA